MLKLKPITTQLTAPLFRYLVLGVCISTLVGIALINAETPIRGEHWALLYGFVNSPTLIEKLQFSANFALFGDHRFQPLNTLPLILEYLIFDFKFLYYALISTALHLSYSLAFIRVIHALNQGGAKNPTPFKIQNYSLEFGLILVLFLGIDVITWSFYQYIQIGAALSLYAVSRYLENFENIHHNNYKTFLIATVALLFYEPFYAVVFTFFLAHLWRYKKNRSLAIRNETLVLLLLVVGFGFKYWNSTLSLAISIPPNVSQIHGLRLYTGHDSLFLAEGALHKPLFLAYNYLLWFLNVLASVFLPAVSHRVNLYEFSNLQFYIGAKLPILLGLALICALYMASSALKKIPRALTEKYFLMFSIHLIIFVMLTLGRPGAGSYVAVQFRYAYVLFPFIAIPFWHTLKPKPYSKSLGYSLALCLLIVINMSSSLNQGFRLKKDMLPITEFIRDLKLKESTPAEILNSTSKSIIDYSLPVVGSTSFLIYNARGGLAHFYKEPNT